MKQVSTAGLLLLLGALVITSSFQPMAVKKAINTESNKQHDLGEMWISGSDCAGTDTYYAHVSGGVEPYTYEWRVVHGTTNVTNVGAYSNADHIFLGTSPDDYVYLEVRDANNDLMGFGWDGMWINDCSR